MDTSLEAIVNILQGFVVGIKRRDVQKCNLQIFRIISSNSSVEKRGDIFSSHKGFALLDVLFDPRSRYFCNSDTIFVLPFWI